MKKFAIIASIALICGAFLSSCSKTTVDLPDQEISFQMARHSVTTRLDDYKDGYQDVPFGTYAWFKGESEADNSDFMTNQSVSYYEAENLWKPTGTTYYWPKTGTIDFISYSPYTADGTDAPAPTVTEDGISYPSWNVAEHQDVDVMYADKVTGLNRNKTTYFYEGVPTLFRHALARVTFNIRAAYLSQTGENGDVTRWEVDINSISLNDILSTGTLDLTLGEEGEWVKPESNVWTPGDETISSSFELEDGALTLEAQPVAGPFFVLPQELLNQTVTVNATIRTYRDNNDGNGERLVYTEEGVDVSATLANDEIDLWGINQSIEYDFVFAPSQIDSNGDPVEITYDPAVADWEIVNISVTIQL